MILYTPIPLEQITEGLEKMQAPVARVVSVEGVPILLEDIGPAQGKVLRLLSTNPRDYLRADLHPGAIIRVPGT